MSAAAINLSVESVCMVVSYSPIQQMRCVALNENEDTHGINPPLSHILDCIP